MVDVQPTEDMAIQPPLPESDAPLMGNPILTRSTGRGRRTSGTRRASGTRSGWQVALPVAAVVVIAGAAGAYFLAKSSQTQPLTANPPAAAPAASAPAAQMPAAVASTAAPTEAPAPPTEAAPPPPASAPAVAPRHERVTRLARAAPIERHATVRHARAAEDQGADVSATAPAAAPPPSAPPVITPPPAAQ